MNVFFSFSGLFDHFLAQFDAVVFVSVLAAAAAAASSKHDALLQLDKRLVYLNAPDRAAISSLLSEILCVRVVLFCNT